MFRNGYERFDQMIRNHSYIRRPLYASLFVILRKNVHKKRSISTENERLVPATIFAVPSVCTWATKLRTMTNNSWKFCLCKALDEMQGGDEYVPNAASIKKELEPGAHGDPLTAGSRRASAFRSDAPLQRIDKV